MSQADSVELGNGQGGLFTLGFKVRSGVSLPSASAISFGSLGGPGETCEGVGLALQQIYDANGDVIDPQLDPYTATPSPLTVTFATTTGLLFMAGLLLVGRFGVGRARPA